MLIIFNHHLIFCRINSCKILASDTYYHKLDAINKKIGILACTAPHGAEDMHGLFFFPVLWRLFIHISIKAKKFNSSKLTSCGVSTKLRSFPICENVNIR